MSYVLVQGVACCLCEPPEGGAGPSEDKNDGIGALEGTETALSKDEAAKTAVPDGEQRERDGIRARVGRSTILPVLPSSRGKRVSGGASADMAGRNTRRRKRPPWNDNVRPFSRHTMVTYKRYISQIAYVKGVSEDSGVRKPIRPRSAPLKERRRIRASSAPLSAAAISENCITATPDITADKEHQRPGSAPSAHALDSSRRRASIPCPRSPDDLSAGLRLHSTLTGIRQTLQRHKLHKSIVAPASSSVDTRLRGPAETYNEKHVATLRSLDRVAADMGEQAPKALTHHVSLAGILGMRQKHVAHGAKVSTARSQIDNRLSPQALSHLERRNEFRERRAGAAASTEGDGAVKKKKRRKKKGPTAEVLEVLEGQQRRVMLGLPPWVGLSFIKPETRWTPQLAAATPLVSEAFAQSVVKTREEVAAWARANPVVPPSAGPPTVTISSRHNSVASVK